MQHAARALATRLSHIKVTTIRRTPIATHKKHSSRRLAPTWPAPTHPDGASSIFGFTSAPEVVAFNPADAVMSLTTAQVLTMAREQGHTGSRSIPLARRSEFRLPRSSDQPRCVETVGRDDLSAHDLRRFAGSQNARVSPSADFAVSRRVRLLSAV